ncbi:MAG: DNRLRE domain-containing protein, partial [Bacteroidales bacterium]|nr:DNRLRE domain-containing protein [Bacteroidales bacterium]
MAAEKGETWTDAAVLPRTSTYDLRASLNPAGRNTNQYEVGNLAWTLFYYWQHCVAYGDEDAMKNKLFPLLKEAINTFIYIRTEKDGKYGLPVTASPEYVSTSAGENTNYDLANLRFGLMTLIDIDTTYNMNDPLLETWKDFLDNLVDFQTDANGYKISSTIGIPSGGTSHRHYSHLFMLYPYHMVSWEDSEEQAALLNTSLSKWNGNQGYSRTGKAAMLASKGDGNGALSQMTTFFDTYIKPNTLYAETGPVIETPLAAVSTLHEFYMQDWGDRIRVFYGLPTSWKEASFINMRAKGAFLVSATRKSGKTVFIQIESEKGGPCRLQTGMPGNNIYVVDMDGNEIPFNLINSENGIIEVNTQPDDVFQIINKSEEPVLPYAIEHPLAETMPYGVNKGPDVPLTSLSFSNETETLTESDPSKFLTLEAEPSFAPVGTVVWANSNSEVVRLQNGLIQAIGPGEAEITVTNIDGISAKCKVTVVGNNFSSYSSISEDDTYAYDSSTGKITTYGDESTIYIKYDGSGYNRMGFFKFSIEDIDKYASEGYLSKIEASLYINSSMATAGNTSWQFFAVPDLTWTEKTLTWNNKPAASTNKLGEIQGKSNIDADSYAESNRVSFDITDYALEQYNSGIKKIAFNATQKNIVAGGAHSSYFASKEHSDARRVPYIKVTKGDKITNIHNPDDFSIQVYP